MIVVCEWCGRLRVGPEEDDVWVAAPDLPAGELVSHGCCPPCDEARYRAAGLAWPGASKVEGAAR